jgi:hypothetical protein
MDGIVRETREINLHPININRENGFSEINLHPKNINRKDGFSPSRSWKPLIHDMKECKQAVTKNVACTTLHPFSVSGHCEDLP